MRRDEGLGMHLTFEPMLLARLSVPIFLITATVLAAAAIKRADTLTERGVASDPQWGLLDDAGEEWGDWEARRDAGAAVLPGR